MARPKMTAWDKRGAYLAESFGLDPKIFAAAIDKAMEGRSLVARSVSTLKSASPLKTVRRRRKSAAADTIE